MKDFTKKGTKLPVIPAGTKFKWLNKGFFTEPCKSNKKGTCKELNFISGGTYQNDNIIYVICDDQSTVKLGMEYLIKLSTIERLAKEQGMYNTNNKTMKVTLQENGTVTVTDTETTTTLSKATVDEICRLVKEQPKLRKINVWYGSKEYPKLCWRSDESNCYGLNWKGNWEFKSRNSKELSTLTGDDYELSPETVEQYLREEFIRLGFKKGCKVKTGFTWEIIGKTRFEFDSEKNKLLLWCDKIRCIETDSVYKVESSLNVFNNGKFATIIKPEPITRAEAEKQTVFVVRHKETGNDFGTFLTREKAEKYIATSSNFTIVENSVN